jgi:hypothetical protein
METFLRHLKNHQQASKTSDFFAGYRSEKRYFRKIAKKELSIEKIQPISY